MGRNLSKLKKKLFSLMKINRSKENEPKVADMTSANSTMSKKTKKPFYKRPLVITTAALFALIVAFGKVEDKPADSKNQIVAGQTVAEKENAAKKAEEERIAKEKAQKEAEEKRLAEEKAQKEAEEQRLAQEQAQREAEEKRLAEEKAQKEAEEQRIAQEEAAKKAQAASSSNSYTTSSSSSTKVVNTNNIGTKVYITNTGKKYHSHDNCGNSQTARQVSLSEAQSRGLTACKKCY